ncbi:MAG TPA: beta-L-arabinofuranosidase domain-containing protein, partial [Actinomycetaceae bacterium]|nr:beta-L-arabinofuranosidase domain-containing protein [Actinomycetaceae bacterium]
MSTSAHAQQRALPVAPSTGVLRPLDLSEVQVTGGFWKDFQDLNASVMIRHAEDWMERVGWIGNFDAAVEGRLPADRKGREFADSDVYKLMEAMAWEIGRTGDAELEARFQALVDRIEPVQEADGYLNTHFGRPGQQPRYSDMEWGHELYCFGHLIQAAVARGRTHGRDRFVEIAIRAADHVCETFGPDGLDTVGGHPEIEPALAELARYTGDRKYLDQAKLFVERRGHGRLGEIWFGPEYFQEDLPVRDAEVLRGHAVRALYLAAGAIDVAVETGDDSLLKAVHGQMARTVARRTYLTGGMGAHHEGEAFGDDFELPADRAYSETCAGIGAAMVGQRLLLATGEATQADLIEKVMYNVVATSTAEDG